MTFTGRRPVFGKEIDVKQGIHQYFQDYPSAALLPPRLPPCTESAVPFQGGRPRCMPSCKKVAASSSVRGLPRQTPTVRTTPSPRFSLERCVAASLRLATCNRLVNAVSPP
eukprot:342567-Prorocentrum_minimum.AAC.2